jgi:hypothetical protein
LGRLDRGPLPHVSNHTTSCHYRVALVGTKSLGRIRQGIQRFNKSHGNTTGDHETITLAWIAVISRFLAGRDRGQPLAGLVEALLVE